MASRGHQAQGRSGTLCVAYRQSTSHVALRSVSAAGSAHSSGVVSSGWLIQRQDASAMLRHLRKVLTHYRGFRKEHREDSGPIPPDTSLITENPQPPSEQGATPEPQTSSFITRTGCALAKLFLLLHSQLLKVKDQPSPAQHLLCPQALDRSSRHLLQKYAF